ncbi:MAG: hypothetical protein AB8H79_08880 [Myxococcota bacterium]
MRATGFWLVLALAACNGTDDIGGTDNPNVLLETLEELPRTDECEVFVTSQGLECDDLEGGSRYLLSNLIFEDEGVLSGEFYFVVVANGPYLDNESWQSSTAHEKGQAYCTVGFGLTGTWTEGGSSECPDCTHEISYNTRYAPGQSDCPSALNQDVRSTADGIEDAYWGVKINDDGTATAVDTNAQWGTEGVGDASGAIVWSDPRCVWYGGDECD